MLKDAARLIGVNAAVMPLGRPVKSLSRLKRKSVPEFAMRERWGGSPLTSTQP